MLGALARAQPISGGATIQLPTLAELPTPPSRIPIFYPPQLPAPGEGIDRIAPLQRAGFDAPAGLAPYVGEPFYPQLGTCLTEDHFTKKRRTALEAYRAKRDAFVNALRSALARGESPPPEVSATAVQGLEAAAFELRSLLAEETYSWGYFRAWTVAHRQPDVPPAQQRAREFQFLRSVIYYHPTLPPAHRRLLGDYVAQVGASSVTDLPDAAPRVDPGLTIPFLPEGSRIRIPDTITAALHADLSRFVRTRFELQQELARTLIAVDGDTSRKRQQSLEAMLKRHEPILARLEADAEAIRVALAALPTAAPPMLPPHVRQLADKLAAARTASHRELIARLQQARERLCRYQTGSEQLYWDSNFTPGSHITVTAGFSPPQLNIAAVVNQSTVQATRAAAQEKALQATLDDFLRATAVQQAAIEAMRSEVILATVRWQNPAHPDDAPYPTAALTAAIRHLQAVERHDRMTLYADCLAATLRPGLAPEQRHLLFAAAVRDLQLPLPPGSRRPAAFFDGP